MERFARSYPLRVQAQAYLDGLREAGVDVTVFEIVQITDRFSPSGYWHRVQVKEG